MSKGAVLTQVREENDLELQRDDLDEEVNLEDELKNSAKFENLVDLVNTNFSEVQGSVQDLLKLKDELLLNFLPPPLLFRVAVVFGNVYRAFSNLNTPVFEMLRLVKIFSAGWEKNAALMKKLNDLHESKKQLLNIAIKRLANVDKKTKLFTKEKRIQNWEKLFVKLNEAKGHGRRWKFRMETFRQKSKAGYTELLQWVMAEPDNGEEPEPINAKRKSVRRDRENRRKSKIEIGKEREMRKNQLNDQLSDDDQLSLKERSQFGDTDDDGKNVIEVDSDQDIFSSEFNSERGSHKKKKESQQDETPAKPPVETSEAETQTQPNVESKLTWTGEPNYTRYFIVRIFKPQEYMTKTLQFKIQLGEDCYTSKNFIVKKGEKKVKIVENKREKKGLRKLKAKNSESLDTVPEPTEIDLEKYEDFLFETDDNFTMKSKTLLTKSLNNSLKFEMDIEDRDAENARSCFSSVNMDDIHTLDLPILYYKTTDEVQESTFYDNKGAVKRFDRENSSSWLRPDEFTEDTHHEYSRLSKRTPFMYDMYNTLQTNKTLELDSVCKLPLMFFWIRKPAARQLDKCTGSETLKDIVEEYTGLDITKLSKQEIQKKMEEKDETPVSESPDKHDIACSPMPMPTVEAPPAPVEPEPQPEPQPEPELAPEPEPEPEPIKEESPVMSPIPALTPKEYDIIEIKQDLTNEEITTMQETYQLKIDELNLKIYKLENEVDSYKANEMRIIEQTSSRAKFKNIKNTTARPAPEKLQKISKSPEPVPSREKPAPKPIKQQVKQPVVPEVPRRQQPTLSQSEFFDRLNFYNEESTKHHKELYNKYMEEEAYIREQQMVVQHRLDTGQRPPNKYEDFCLPAVFMPFKSGNSVYNPRAHKYFHPSGSNDIRLTQPPAIFQLPALPAKSSISVINLFDLGKRYQNGEPDYYINEYINRQYVNTQDSLKPPTQQTGGTNNGNSLGSTGFKRQLSQTQKYNVNEQRADDEREKGAAFFVDSDPSQLNLNLNDLRND